jgi:hypothetical protein
LNIKKGLRDSSLIRKLTMRNPRMSEEMLAIKNEYALDEEATLDTRQQKKEKESGHNKKRKADHSVNNVEQPHCNKECVTPSFKAKLNAHSMCAQESSLHTYHIENGYRITSVTIYNIYYQIMSYKRLS